MNREAWLTLATELLIAHFNVPPRAPLRVTCGWPARGALSPTRPRVGECWPDSASKDGTIEILVSPALDSVVEILGTIAHELIHAHLPPEVGHKAQFKFFAERMLLEGKPTCAGAGLMFELNVAHIIEELGPYPHARIIYEAKPKQSTRMLKAECVLCGYTIRLARKWAEVGIPDCPDCKVRLEMEDMEE